MTQILQVVAQQLNENIGSRITSALANGILFAVDQQVKAEAAANEAATKVEPAPETQGI